MVKKKEREDLRKARTAKERRKKLTDVLSRLGISKSINNSQTRERLLSVYYPKPTVRIASNTIEDDELRKIRKLIESALFESTFNCPSLGDGYSVLDYFSLVKPLLDSIAKCDWSSEMKNLDSDDTLQRAFDAAYKAIDGILILLSRIDTRLLRVGLQCGRNEHDKFVVIFELHAVPKDQIDVLVEGEKRSAFRAGAPFGPDPIQWIEWPAESVGEDSHAEKFPVYVQSHALRRFYERLSIHETHVAFMQDCMCCALRKPQLSRMINREDGFLCEFSFGKKKLGYFVVKKHTDIFLVHTFLFLTMNGTPEGEMLWKKYRLLRGDKEHLEIDRFVTWANSDIRNDPELMQLFEECGCGHLPNVLPSPSPNKSRPGYAEEIRKYLNIAVK